jgi:hypothetical protein
MAPLGRLPPRFFAGANSGNCSATASPARAPMLRFFVNRTLTHHR